MLKGYIFWILLVVSFLYFLGLLIPGSIYLSAGCQNPNNCQPWNQITGYQIKNAYYTQADASIVTRRLAGGGGGGGRSGGGGGGRSYSSSSYSSSSGEGQSEPTNFPTIPFVYGGLFSKYSDSTQNKGNVYTFNSTYAYFNGSYCTVQVTAEDYKYLGLSDALLKSQPILLNKKSSSVCQLPANVMLYWFRGCLLVNFAFLPIYIGLAIYIYSLLRKDGNNGNEDPEKVPFAMGR